MSTEEQIKLALTHLNDARVDTAGLGAPINILKRLLEDLKNPDGEIQTEDIIDIINENYGLYKGINEGVLHAAEDIIELFKSKA